MIGVCLDTKEIGKLVFLLVFTVEQCYPSPMSTLGEIESAVEQLPLAEQEELLSRLTIKLGGQIAAEFPVREDHLQLLNERFAAYRDDPSQASTWEDVKLRFASRRR